MTDNQQNVKRNDLQSQQSTGIVVNDNNEGILRRSALDSGDLDVDKLLSEKLNKMSIEERTHGIHELHGVAAVEKEDPKMIETKLKEIDELMGLLSENDTSAYRKAVEMGKDYVEHIKLLCLRADYYKSEKAATRLALFFSYKEELFGTEKLVKEITLQDFEGEDMEGLRNGIFQLLQQRDRAGRAIIMFVGSQAVEYSVETVFRSLFFVVMTTLRDQDIQTNGVVLILYTIGQQKFHSDRPKKLANTFLRLPVRQAAIHVCYDRKLMDLAVKMFCHSMESQHLCRFRGHYGTYLECMYNLMTFGIPKDAFPIDTTNGAVLFEAHHRWLEMVRAREAAVAAAAAAETSQMNGADIVRSVTPDNEIAVPGPMDIIVGRGVLSRSSPGYMRMQNFVQEYYDQYEAAGRMEKINISKIILQKTTEAGCRFVRWSPTGLVWCNELESREKISHTFRNMRRSAKKDRDKVAKRSAAPEETVPPSKRGVQSNVEFS